MVSPYVFVRRPAVCRDALYCQRHSGGMSTDGCQVATKRARKIAIKIVAAGVRATKLAINTARLVAATVAGGMAGTWYYRPRLDELATKITDSLVQLKANIAEAYAINPQYFTTLGANIQSVNIPEQTQLLKNSTNILEELKIYLVRKKNVAQRQVN